MTEEINPAQKYLNTRAKNLSFFQRTYPGIYEAFVNYQLQSLTLDIIPDGDEVDIIHDGQHIYGGAGKRYSVNEVSTFRSAYDSESRLKSIVPLFEGDYKNPRFFSQKLDKLYRLSPIKRSTFSSYRLPDFYPMIVFMGCGLGVHIAELCKQKDIKNIYVVESDLDKFAASLYVTDWEQIVADYLDADDRTFNFVLLNSNKERDIRTVVWNHLIEDAPIFPVATLFYNHQGNKLYDRIIDSINADLYVHLFSFGNYDDELNQLNNATHNFKNDIALLPEPAGSEINVPVCIVGSGPSLDDRIKNLKYLAPNAVVISCGTALRALYVYGIKPDIHIELESDYNTYDTQKLMEDKAYMQSINVIGAAQLNPLLFSLFGKSRLFFKDSGSVPGVFPHKEGIIPNATPTCTNAALAFAFHFGFKQLFLFGLDYGFPSKEQHHAKGTLYYKEGAPDSLKKSAEKNDDQLYEVPGASGGNIQTSPFLYASKRRIDNLLLSYPHSQVYNCSNGAVLEGAEWLKPNEVKKKVKSRDPLGKKNILDYLFNDDAKRFNLADVNLHLTKLKHGVELLAADCHRILSKNEPYTIEGVVKISIQINKLLKQLLLTGDSGLYYLMRGSIWHFLLAGLSHSLSIEDESKRSKYINDWLTSFKSFLEDIPSHLTSIIFSDLDIQEDQMVNKSIGQLAIEDLQWEYQGYSIINNQIVMDNIEWEFRGFLFKDGKYTAPKDA